MKKKLLSLLLALVLLLGMVPATALAAEAEDADLPAAVDLEEPAEVVEDIEEVFLTEDPAEPEPAEAVILTEEEPLIAEPLDGEEPEPSPEPTEEPGEPTIVDQGTCGATDADNVNWVLTSDGILTISGTGATKDFSSFASAAAPWIVYKDQITKIVINEGVTRIGTRAFFRNNSNSMTLVTEVALAESVESVGQRAFNNMSAFTVNYAGCPATWAQLLENTDTYNDPLLNATVVFAKENAPVVSLEISGNYQTLYAVGQEFDPTGVIVKGVTANGSKLNLTKKVTYSALDSSSLGEKEVIVTYTEDDLTVTGVITVSVVEDDVVLFSGFCGAEEGGQNLTWTLTVDGKLTIAGTGEMNNGYAQFQNFAPWYEHTGLVREIVIAEGVTSVGNYAFVHQDMMTGQYYSYDKLTGLTLADSLVKIGNGAFTNLPITGSLILPATIQNLGGGTFMNCTQLEHVTVYCNLINSNFYGCTGLKSAEIYGTMEGNQIFTNCTALETVILGENSKKIPAFTFSGCTSLSTIDLSGVEIIDGRAFSGCTALKTVSIPAGVTVGSQPFDGCTGLETATTGSVGASMFYGCSGLTEVTLLDGVTEFTDKMFANCTSLRTVTVPASVTEFSANAFDGVASLPEFRGEGGPAAEAFYNFQTDENGVVYSGDGKVLVSIPADFAGELVIRDGVVTVSNDVAKNHTGITGVVFPDSLRTIGSSAFYGCTGLTAAIIPDGVTTIGSTAFQNCSALAQVKLPAGITELSLWTFRDCIALTSIEIPEGVTSLGGSFWGCASLAEVTLPSTLRDLGSNTFNGCALTSVVIPEGVEEIPNMCFFNCDALEWIVLPYSLKTMGSNPIRSNALQTIYYPGSYDEFDAIVWDSIQNKAILDRVELVCYYGPEGDPADAPVITVQPEDKVFAQNADATDALLVTVQAAAEGERLYLDWFSKESESAAGRRISSTLSADGLTAAVTPGTAETGNTYYYCMATKIAADGTVTRTYSNTVLVTVVEDIGLDGIGTVANPYQLKNLDDIEILRQLIAAGKQFKGVWFALMADITLPADWAPLGYMADEPLPGRVNKMVPFVGNLEGNGHTVTIPEGGSGLFGYVRESTVQNLNFLANGAATPVLLVNGYSDYGDDNSSSTGIPDTLDAINCTIKSGSVVNAAGFIVGTGSSGNNVNFVGCTVESGVRVVDGSFARSFVGTITECVSHADVTGESGVGGFVGQRANSVGLCDIKNSVFDGTVTATGDKVGGFVGKGYEDATAPNGCYVRIDGCTMAGTVSGGNMVGGLLGSEGGIQQTYNAASYGSLSDNTITGTVTATGNYVGALAGLYSHLDRYTRIDNNDYSACSVNMPFGRVYHVDTNAVELGWHDVAGMADQVFYFDSSRTDYTAEQLEMIYNALWTGWEDTSRWKPSGITPNFNRFDDPLAGGNSGEVTVTSLTLSGEFKTEYLIGDPLDTANMVITVLYSDGTSKEIKPEDEEFQNVEFSGFDTSAPGEKEVAVVFGGAAAYFTITVKAPEGSINVKLSILGDTLHDDGEIHTLKDGNLITWLEETEFTVDSNDTVWDLLLKAFEEHGFTFTYYMSLGTEYIDSVTFNGVTLKEKDNNPNSGWQYTINGQDSSNGVRQQPLVEGDVICFHWTDDYTQENYGDDDMAVYAVIDMIDALPDPEDLTLDDEEAVKAAREAYDALTDEQKEKVGDIYEKLLADEAKLEELKAAGKVKVTGVSLTLKGQIGIYIYAQMPEGAATAKLTYPKTGEVKEYTLDKNKNYYIESSDQYKFLYENVPAKELTQPLELEVFDENGNALPITHVRLGDYGTKFTCQAVDYCNTIIENPDQPEKLKDLVKAILNYGQCAQLQFGYDVDNLANPEGYLAEEMKTVQADPANDAEIPANAKDDVGWEYGTLSLKGAVNANLYFSKEITARDENGKAYTVKAKSGGKWSITVDNIPAKNLGDKFTVVASYGGKTATIKYSALSYINAVLGNESQPETLKELCKAMILYNQYAKAYFGN